MTVPVTKSLFIANGIKYLSRSDSWEYLAALDATLRKNRSAPLDAYGWYQGFVQMQAARRDALMSAAPGLPSRATYADRLLKWVDESSPLFGPAVDMARDYLAENRTLQGLKNDETGATAHARTSVYLKYSPQAEKLLGELYDLAQTNPKAKEAWDELMARDLGKVSATAEAIVAENPELRSMMERLQAAPTEGDAREAIKVDVKFLIENVGRIESKLELIDTTKKTADRKGATLEEQAEAARKERDLEVRRQTTENALRGAVAIYSFLGGNPATIRQLNGILNAYSSAYAAVKAYNAAILAGSSTGMASLAMAGSWAGIAIALSAAFSGSDAEAEMQEQLFGALNRISQQLQAIQKQLAQGFESIDKRLVGLSEQMQAGFEAVLSGIQGNRLQLTELTSAAYSLSRNLTESVDLILERLKDGFDAQLYEDVLSYANHLGNTGDYLTAAQRSAAATALLKITARGKDAVHSGRPLLNLGTPLEQWLASKEADQAGDWQTNINMYRSLCSLLGASLNEAPSVNPGMWRFAAESAIGIAVKNCETPRALGNALPQLLADGKALQQDVATLRAGNAGSLDTLDLAFELLIEQYAAAMREVESAVQSVHQHQILLVNPTATPGQMLERFAFAVENARDLAESLGTGLTVVDGSFSIEAHPSPAGKTLIEEASPPGLMPFEAMSKILEFDECVPSFYDPATWPVMKSPLRAWNSLPLELRADAILAQMLGMGMMQFEYQAQIEEMRLTKTDNIVGRPKVHFVLLLETAGSRTGVAHTVQWVAESNIQEVCCWARKDVYDPWLSLQFKSLFLEFGGQFNYQEGQAIKPFISSDELKSRVEERYTAIAVGTNDMLRAQLDAPDSTLGAAARKLTRTTELIRGMTSWLLPDLVESNDALRTALYGPASSWMGYTSVRDLKAWVPTRPERHGGLPLFDGTTLRELVANSASFSREEAAHWPPTLFLGEVDTYLTLSINGFREALRKARANGIPAGYVHPIDETLSRLELLQKLITLPTSAEEGSPMGD